MIADRIGQEILFSINHVNKKLKFEEEIERKSDKVKPVGSWSQ